MKSIIIILSSLILVISCKKNDEKSCDKQNPSFDDLHGVWVDSGLNVQIGYVVTFDLKLTTDSFFIAERVVTDEFFADCNFINEYDNYAKGDFNLNNRTLRLNGFYCDSTYTDSLTESSCPNLIFTGDFQDTLNAYFLCDTLVLERNRYPYTVKFVPQ